MPKYVIWLIIFFSIPSFATEQIKESFIVDGVSKDIDSNPLEALFTYEEIHLMLDSKGFCTANWRGYKGTWELKDGELFLTSLVEGVCSENPPLIDPGLFFGEKEYPVKATWFNSQIEVRLSKNKYSECLTPEKEKVLTGYSYDAMVYEFSAGDFVYKSKQRIKHEWQRNITKC